NGTVTKEFIQCKFEPSRCKTIYKYDSTYGSKTQNLHLINVHMFTKNSKGELVEPKVTVHQSESFSKQTESSDLRRAFLKKLPREDYNKLKSALIFFVANDLRPFEAI